MDESNPGREPGLLPIGMFSRASLLSIKTLRAYHEAGILVPARIDRFTGYRMYTVDQLADAAIVRRLRALDLPLERVREVLSSRDPEVTRQILASHQIAMQARLVETERIVAELQSGSAPLTHTPVHVRSEAAQDTLRITAQVSEADFGDWIVGALERLIDVLAMVDVAPAGPLGTLYGPEFPDEQAEQVEAFVPIPAPVGLPRTVRDVQLGELPAVQTAVLVHIGDYDGLVETYRTLGAWVARHAAPSGERIRERYVVSPAEVDDPAAYRTELCWPIRATT